MSSSSSSEVKASFRLSIIPSASRFGGSKINIVAEEEEAPRKFEAIAPLKKDVTGSLKKQLKEKDHLVEELQHENEEIKQEVKVLAKELEELHDTFREDQASEFRDLKRELEVAAKNCRLMCLKVKKTERQCEQLELEKLEMEKKVKEMLNTGLLSGDKTRMKELENELAMAKEVSLKLHSELEILRGERAAIDGELNEARTKLAAKNGSTSKLSSAGAKTPKLGARSLSKDGKLTPGPTLSPQVSFDASKEKEFEEVVRSLYDTMEREKDLQEQMKYAEEESRTMRKKLSTMEQENEILMMQIRKMATKKGKIDEDSDELNPEEMKLHLELYEQEMSVLRKKTDELEQENDNLTQEVKYLSEKLVSTPLTRVEIPEIPPGSPPNIIYEHKIRILETEARELRKKMVDKEKENESLRTEVDVHRRKATKVMVRSRSLESEGQVDLKRQLQLVEQEASILRQKLISLESENEKLGGENKRLQLRVSRKPPAGPTEKLQLENLEFKQKLEVMEKKCETLQKELQASISSPNIASLSQDSNKTSNKSSKAGGALSSNESDLIDALKKQLKSKEDEVLELQSKAARIETENSKVNREFKKLKEAFSFKRKGRRPIKDSATRIELKNMVTEMDEEIVTLENMCKARETLNNFTEAELIETKRKLDLILIEQRTAEGASSKSETKEQPSERKLDSNKEKAADLGHLQGLEAEKKEMNIRLTDLETELTKEKSRADDVSEKLTLVNHLKEELAESNKNLMLEKERIEDQLETHKEKLRELESEMKEVRNKYEDAENEVTNLRKECNQLKTKLEEERDKNNKTASRTDLTNISGFSMKERDDLRRQLQEMRSRNETIQRDLDKQARQHKDKERNIKEEYTSKLESAIKEIRAEAQVDKQTTKDENVALKNKLSEVNDQIERLGIELKELSEKNRQLSSNFRKESQDLQTKIADQESLIRSETRKREKIERENELALKCKDEELIQTRDRVVQLEREQRRTQTRLEQVESDYERKHAATERDLFKTKQENVDIKSKEKSLERELHDAKLRLSQEKDTLVEAISTLKRSYDEKLVELKALKESFASRQEIWIKEKLDLQERVTEMGGKATRLSELDSERRRLKEIVEERDNIIETNRREEQEIKDENDKLKKKVDELTANIKEKESKGSRAQDIRIKHSETSHKGDLAALHAEYEARMKVMGDEVMELQRQIAFLMEERDNLRAHVAMSEPGMRVGFRDEVEDLTAQLESLRTHLEQALVDNRNMKVTHASEKSSWQVQMAELKTRLNQSDEQLLMESSRGSTRNYARPRLELAWEKERQEQQKLLQNTQRLVDDMRDKLIQMENHREKERSEARRQLHELKAIMDKEQEETQKRIGELQLDLIDLRDSHAKIRSQNERLKRERIALQAEQEAFRLKMFAAIDIQNKVDELSADWEELIKIVPAEEKKAEASDTTAADNASAAVKKPLKKKAPAINVDELRQATEKVKKKIEELKNVSLDKDDKFKRALSFKRAISASDMGTASYARSSRGPQPVLSQMRAPPRPKALAKKSLSLDQNISNLTSASQERIWQSGESLATTPASSITNLRYGLGMPNPYYQYPHRGGYSSISGYESEGSFGHDSYRYQREGSYGDRSDVSAPATPATKQKKTLRDKFRLLNKRPESVGDSGSQGSLDSKSAAAERDKKESSLRSRISKTLKKTLGRSSDTLSKDQKEQSAYASDDRQPSSRPQSSLDYTFGASYSSYGGNTLTPGARPPVGPSEARKVPSKINPASKEGDPRRTELVAGRSGTLPGRSTRAKPETRV